MRNYGNPSILIPPLSEWKKIKINCGDNPRTIPSEKMLRDARMTLSKNQQKYHERINESCRRKMVLFSDYYKAKLYKKKVYQLLAQE